MAEFEETRIHSIKIICSMWPISFAGRDQFTRNFDVDLKRKWSNSDFFLLRKAVFKKCSELSMIWMSFINHLQFTSRDAN